MTGFACPVCRTEVTSEHRIGAVNVPEPLIRWAAYRCPECSAEITVTLKALPRDARV